MIARRFRLVRDVDVSGVSGTGQVAGGMALGPIALIWWYGKYKTITLHLRGMGSVEHIHCHGGLTRVVSPSSTSPPLGLPAMICRRRPGSLQGS